MINAFLPRPPRRPIRRHCAPQIELLEDRILLATDIPAVLLLNPAGPATLNATGNGVVLVSGAGSIVVNSVSPQAGRVTGNALVSADDLYFAGNPGYAVTGNGRFQGSLHPGATPVADSLAGLPLPEAPVPTFAAVHWSANSTLTLSPGAYVGGISVAGHGSVLLLPGTYYLNGGGLTVSGNGSVVGNGVTIYNAPHGTSDTISISGNANVYLTPPLSGLYQDITIFEDRTSTAPLDVVPLPEMSADLAA